MILDSGTGKKTGSGTRRALRYWVIPLAIVLLAAILILVDCEEERPNYYAPARVPLTHAAMILSETYTEETELLRKLGTVHDRLDRAIGLLRQAEQLDPADRQRIEELEARLQALENDHRILSTDPKSLQDAYHELTEQLTALATRLEQPVRQTSQ